MPKPADSECGGQVEEAVSIRIPYVRARGSLPGRRRLSREYFTLPRKEHGRIQVICFAECWGRCGIFDVKSGMGNRIPPKVFVENNLEETMQRGLIAAALTLYVAFAGGAASAQTYPSGPIRWLV